MRLVLFLILALSPIALSAQSTSEWHRVYTFDESTIDMNTLLVTEVSKEVSRVRFRWTFEEPQSLAGKPQVTYQSQLEVIELNCSENQYRPFHITFFDAAGNIVRIDDAPGKWHHVQGGSMIKKLFEPGCELIKKRNTPPPPAKAEDKDARLTKVAEFALEFARQLEQTNDIGPLIDRHFVTDYLEGYLQDQRTNWFVNLDRITAGTLNRQELQRFYVAVMNAGYLNSLYLINQLPPDSEESAVSEKLLPPDVVVLIKSHPYTTQYRTRANDYDFLAETISSADRLGSYTDLLESINSLMREHVKRVGAAESQAWRKMLEEWDLYNPASRVCGKNCFGLPAGTSLFEVNVPVFRLQVAEVGGNLKVVSATSRF